MHKMSNPHVFTLGIEEEFQIIDPETRELRSHIRQILEDGKIMLKEHVKAEMHQSVVELGTEICPDIAVRARARSCSCARELATRRRPARTHDRFRRHASVFALDESVHHGRRTLRHDRERHATDRARQPHLRPACARRNSRSRGSHPVDEPGALFPAAHLRLSVNSPFWLGQNTGFKAYRHNIFERFPRTGIPDPFESLSEYEDYLKLLVETNCIDNAKKIWWDIRLHPFFDTLEFRICDAQTRVDDTIALAAMIQAVVVKLHKLLRQNTSFRIYRRRVIDENRWRASRYGIDGKLIDFGRHCEVETRSLIHEILEFIAPEVRELGTEREMAHIERIMREGTGADRQLAAFETRHDVKDVVDHIVSETYEGIEIPDGQKAARMAAS